MVSSIFWAITIGELCLVILNRHKAILLDLRALARLGLADFLGLAPADELAHVGVLWLELRLPVNVVTFGCSDPVVLVSIML